MAGSALNTAFKSIAFGCGLILFNNHVASFVICSGPSMEPTLQTGDVLLTERLSSKFGLIEKGDIVIAKCPENPRIRVCKRVAAKPGDIVPYKGFVYRIPEGYYWLLGDNKSNSNDSRFYGPVGSSMICARCFCRVWPDVSADSLVKKSSFKGLNSKTL